MEDLQLTLTPARVDQRNFGVMLSNWRVGQVINALVVDRMPSGNVLLNAGGREFVTPLDLPVQPGTRLQLEVQQVTPQLVLRFLAGSEKTGLQSGAESLSRPTQPGSGLAGTTLLGGGITAANVLSALATQPNLRALRIKALCSRPCLPFIQSGSAFKHTLRWPSVAGGGAIGPVY